MVPIKKEHDNGKTTTYKLKFIDRYRFTETKWLELIESLSGINNKECKSCMERKKADQIAILDLKIIDQITDAKNAEKCSKLINDAIKNFPIIY